MSGEIKYLDLEKQIEIDMNAIAKQKVKEHLSTEYGKQMIEIHGLKYVKKEIYQAVKNYNLGDKREQKCY